MEVDKIASALAAITVTVVEALADGSVILKASTLAEAADCDAVNNPLLVMVPPVADQTTATSLVPLSVAVN